jgi:hypothetical protein
MSNTRIHALLPGFSVALSAVLRLAKAVVGLALLMGAIVLALGLVLGLLLRAVLKGRRPPSVDSGWRGAMQRGGRPVSASRTRSSPGEVVDVEVREVMTPGTRRH